MAEAIAVIGTAGALVNIIDVVSKSVASINALRNAWNDADLTLVCLEIELSSLALVFTRLHTWFEREDVELHYCIELQLQKSISCCKLLEGILAGLSRSNDDTLTFSGRTKFVIGKEGLDDLEGLIQRQTSALTLLLTACNW